MSKYISRITSASIFSSYKISSMSHGSKMLMFCLMQAGLCIFPVAMSIIENQLVNFHKLRHHLIFPYGMLSLFQPDLAPRSHF